MGRGVTTTLLGFFFLKITRKLSDIVLSESDDDIADVDDHSEVRKLIFWK